MNSRSKYLLISDLDDTFLGDRSALRRFSVHFAKCASSVSIVYASGRFFDSIREDIQSSPLPEPVAVIAGVGSEIRSFPQGELNTRWVQRIGNHWSADAVRRLLRDESDLQPQPDSSQSEWKVSYFLSRATQQRLDQLQAKLFDAEVDAALIYSSGRDLDILPRGVNKGTAAAFLARELGYHTDHVIVAGNSGNDATLFEREFCGIIVANAHDDLKHVADEERVYVSPDARADGVWDGLQHWISRRGGADE